MLMKTLLKRAAAGPATRSTQPACSLSGLATAPTSQQYASPNATTPEKQNNPPCEGEIKSEFYEHCTLGSDRQVAEMKITAYGKGATEPVEQITVAEGECKNLRHASNPLTISSASPSASESCNSGLERSPWIQKQQGSGMIKGVTVKQGYCKKYD